MKLDNKGLTLINALFGFFIYINIIVFMMSLLSQCYNSQLRIENYIYNLNQKEVSLLTIESYENLIKMVLH